MNVSTRSILLASATALTAIMAAAPVLAGHPKYLNACSAEAIAIWQKVSLSQGGNSVAVNIDWSDGTSATIITATADGGIFSALYGIKAGSSEYCYSGVQARVTGDQIILDLGDNPGHYIYLQLSGGKVVGALHTYGKGKTLKGETQSSAKKISPAR